MKRLKDYSNFVPLREFVERYHAKVAFTCVNGCTIKLLDTLDLLETLAIPFSMFAGSSSPGITVPPQHMRLIHKDDWFLMCVSYGGIFVDITYEEEIKLLSKAEEGEV